MERLIDADKLKEEVLKWLPPDPCGQEEKEYPFETDIVVSMMMTIEEAETVKAIPEDWIKAYIEEVDAMPDKLVWGRDKNAILTMLRAWEVRKEQEGN